MTDTRLICVNGIYFKYPVTVSLNDADFLLALLAESKQANPEVVHTVRKDETGFVFNGL